jgi:pimeloyl-[acyl-carrier protein] methyl ester esterase
MGVSTILKMFDHVVSRVDSLVFISGTPSLVARDDYRHGLPQAEVSSLLRAIKKNYLPGMERFYRLMFQGEDLQHPQRETITALAADTVRAPRQDVACESLQSMLQEDLRAQVKNIPVPALLIHGRLDRICLPEASQYMAERLANACLRIVESTGHVPFLTAADEVHREVRRFIRSWQ